MLREDNSGFVRFPLPDININRIENNDKTFIYIVVFDSEDVTNSPYILSNLRLMNPGKFISDDISSKNIDIYFADSEKRSIPLTTCICVGWSENTFEYKDGSDYIFSFKDLTNEGRKLYYSIKKLHNNKEVRILTFNKIIK